MNYTITLTAEQLNVVLQLLDTGSHKVVRPIIDTIISQAQGQQKVEEPKAEEPAAA